MIGLPPIQFREFTDEKLKIGQLVASAAVVDYFCRKYVNYQCKADAGTRYVRLSSWPAIARSSMTPRLGTSSYRRVSCLYLLTQSILLLG